MRAWHARRGPWHLQGGHPALTHLAPACLAMCRGPERPKRVADSLTRRRARLHRKGEQQWRGGAVQWLCLGAWCHGCHWAGLIFQRRRTSSMTGQGPDTLPVCAVLCRAADRSATLGCPGWSPLTHPSLRRAPTGERAGKAWQSPVSASATFLFATWPLAPLDAQLTLPSCCSAPLCTPAQHRHPHAPRGELIESLGLLLTGCWHHAEGLLVSDC